MWRRLSHSLLLSLFQMMRFMVPPIRIPLGSALHRLEAAPRLVVLTVTLFSSHTLLTPIALTAPETAWEHLAEGLAVRVWEPGSRCGGEVPALLLVRVDPERFRFATYHYRDEDLPAPITIRDWQERTRATILFNAGLFREDYSYLGLLFKDGRSLGSKTHARWKGLFVAEPTASGLKKARVVDLARESFSPDASTYREMAQSLMLVDARGKPRVQHTGKHARQTVVGEDKAGNILIIKTAAGVALWELAVCLRDGVPTLRHAMLMDGGSSSDLLIVSTLLGGKGADRKTPRWVSMADGSATAHTPLPAVIGVRPRR